MIDGYNSLQISHVALKNFRCFNQITIDLNSSIVLICGSNGAGKTSLLEALYYACYLRSFRTHNVRDLIALQKESFFLKLIIHNNTINNSLEHVINIGFSENKRLVKIDNKTTVSYKDLLSHYRIISLTEDDVLLIKGAPEDRRNFIDQLLFVQNSSFISTIKEFKIILEQRNSLLNNTYIDQESYFIWTQKLWAQTSKIQIIRKQILKELELEINKILSHYLNDEFTITFSYSSKKDSDLPFETFWAKHESLLKEELYFKRSLFGIHLDDFIISLGGKKSRAFASRGQQKMIVLLIKAAQIKLLTLQKGPVIFLLDDFMTDFDPQKGLALLSVLLSLNCQLIFTSPHQNSSLEALFESLKKEFKKISI